MGLSVYISGSSCKTSLHSPTHTGKQIFPSVRFPACSGKDRPHCTPLQPPPLPQKKTVSRAVSSPDGFYWGPASPARAAIPTSPKLSFSQSESNVCIREESPFASNLGLNHRTLSSSESLGKASRGAHSLFPPSGKHSNTCCIQNRNLPSCSSSQHSMSTQLSSGSSLQLHNLLSNIDNKEGVYAKLGGLYAESLRRLVSKCEDCFMRDLKSELHFNENNWSLFKLTCNKPCCDSGDAIYYCATCSKDPSSTYAVKVCCCREPLREIPYVFLKLLSQNGEEHYLQVWHPHISLSTGADPAPPPSKHNRSCATKTAIDTSQYHSSQWHS